MLANTVLQENPARKPGVVHGCLHEASTAGHSHFPLQGKIFSSFFFKRWFHLCPFNFYLFSSGQHAVHTSPLEKGQVLHEQGRSGAIITVAAIIIFVFKIRHSGQNVSADPLTSNRFMVNQYVFVYFCFCIGP
jgi:hypothetical protein